MMQSALAKSKSGDEKSILNHQQRARNFYALSGMRSWWTSGWGPLRPPEFFELNPFPYMIWNPDSLYFYASINSSRYCT
jgi:hypothetical protein